MITVTGATGQLGRLVVDGLLERVPANQIVAAVRDPGKAADLAARGVDVRRADYDEPDTLLPALAGTDKLLLISANNPVRSLPMHTAVIDAARQVKVGLLAFTSMILASLAPRETDPVIQASGLPYTLLRNALYTDHFAPQIQQALATGELIGSSGDGRNASATRADLAAAAVAVLAGEGHENKIYELTGDTAWSFAELAAEITKASGKQVTYRNVTPEEQFEMVLAAGVPRRQAEVYIANYVAVGSGQLAATTTDLRDLIGRPTTTMAEWVAKTVNS